MNLEKLVQSYKLYVEAQEKEDKFPYSSFGSFGYELVREYQKQIEELFIGKTFDICGPIVSHVRISIEDEKENIIAVKRLHGIEELVKDLKDFPYGKLSDGVKVEIGRPIPGGFYADVFDLDIPLTYFKEKVKKYKLNVLRNPNWNHFIYLEEQINFVKSLDTWQE